MPIVDILKKRFYNDSIEKTWSIKNAGVTERII